MAVRPSLLLNSPLGRLLGALVLLGSAAALWFGRASIARPAEIVSAWAFAATLFVFCAWPEAGRAATRRPTYLEDIELPPPDEDAEERERRRRAVALYDRGVAVSTAIGAAMVGEYAMLHYSGTTLSRLEIVGVVGGLLSLFSNLHASAAALVLQALAIHRARRRRRRRARTRDLEFAVRMPSPRVAPVAAEQGEARPAAVTTS